MGMNYGYGLKLVPHTIYPTATHVCYHSLHGPYSNVQLYCSSSWSSCPKSSSAAVNSVSVSCEGFSKSAYNYYIVVPSRSERMRTSCDREALVTDSLYGDRRQLPWSTIPMLWSSMPICNQLYFHREGQILDIKASFKPLGVFNIYGLYRPNHSNHSRRHSRGHPCLYQTSGISSVWKDWRQAQPWPEPVTGMTNNGRCTLIWIVNHVQK